MRGKKFDGRGIVLLGKRTVAHHVGEHEGGELALFWTHQEFIQPLKNSLTFGRRIFFRSFSAAPFQIHPETGQTRAANQGAAHTH